MPPGSSSSESAGSRQQQQACYQLLGSSLIICFPLLACRTGDPGTDWDLLQRMSFSNPEAFWPHMLKQLGIRFHKPPHRCSWPSGCPVA
jgi:hypothetical protein